MEITPDDEPSPPLGPPFCVPEIFATLSLSQGDVGGQPGAPDDDKPDDKEMTKRIPRLKEKAQESDQDKPDAPADIGDGIVLPG